MSRRFVFAAVLFVLAITQFITPVKAQGLLGNTYFDTEFIYYSPEDDFLREIDGFIPGVQANLNVPLVPGSAEVLGIDAWGRFRGLWISGTVDFLGTDIDTDIDYYGAAVGANFYLSMWSAVRPWFGIGYEFSRSHLEMTDGVVTVKEKNNDNGLLLSVGLETTITEMLAARTSFEWGSNLFDENSLEDPMFVGEFVVSLPENHWYLRLGGFVDFDGNAGALAGAGVKF